MDRRQADPTDDVWAQRAAVGPADHQHRWQRHGNTQQHVTSFTFINPELQNNICIKITAILL